MELFTQKVVTKLALKNMSLGSGIRDLGYGINLFQIPDPGVKKAPDPGSGSATLVSKDAGKPRTVQSLYWHLAVIVVNHGWAIYHKKAIVTFVKNGDRLPSSVYKTEHIVPRQGHRMKTRP
jgi:hypothetical protein